MPALPVSVIIPARNEARNLPRCLASLGDVGEVYLLDSQSTDDTVRVAQSYGARVVQFHYRGGWPKKRQWAMDTLPLAYDWVLLLDADEVLTPELSAEIQHAIQDPNFDGYYISLEMHFLGRRLRHSGASFWKLSLFRKGRGRYECRLSDQDKNMADMEVHEHVIVDGATRQLRQPLVHHNVESLDHEVCVRHPLPVYITLDQAPIRKDADKYQNGNRRSKARRDFIPECHSINPGQNTSIGMRGINLRPRARP